MRVERFVLAVVVCAVAGLACSTAPALAAGDANQSSCPNEANTGYRATLPDCRAYERVTPANKNGFALNEASLQEDNTHTINVITESIGADAGATARSDCPLNEYATSRATGEWLTTPLNRAPLATYVYATAHCTPLILGKEGAVLMQLHPASKSIYEDDLYLQPPGAGPPVAVGPVLPPTAVPAGPAGSGEQADNTASFSYLGATPDLSHVLFTIMAQNDTLPAGVETNLWPGDTTQLGHETTGLTSLYEYTGTGNSTPTLVGVDNHGQLISDCGTSAGGSSFGNRSNAISTDGANVFFTAAGSDNVSCAGVTTAPPVSEIFARLHGTQTLAISEPDALTPAPANEACVETSCVKNTTETANFRDANYEGAAADGSTMFFTSPQQLVDNATQDSNPADGAIPENGEKGCAATEGPNGCNLYEYRIDASGNGHLSTLSTGDSSGLGPEVQGVAAVSEDGTHVYFVARGVLTGEPRGGPAGACMGELSSAQRTEEESTKEGPCRPKANAENLYVTDTTTDTTRFIATLAGGDANQWSYNGELHPATHSGPMDVTDDGRYLVFTSTAPLTADDTGSARQVYRYQTEGEVLTRVSIGENGYNHNGTINPGKTFLQRAGSRGYETRRDDRHPAISEDGAIVTFTSSNGLTPQATNNECVLESEGVCEEYAQNVYEYRDGHVYLIFTGHDSPFNSSLAAVSPSGQDILFNAREALVPNDKDSLVDIYDARSDGGTPASAEPPCTAETCPPSATTAPASTGPASETYRGPGNPPPAAATPRKVSVAHCAKGRHLAHGRCVCPRGTRAEHGRCTRVKPKPTRGRRSSAPRRGRLPS